MWGRPLVARSGLKSFGSQVEVPKRLVSLLMQSWGKASVYFGARHRQVTYTKLEGPMNVEGVDKADSSVVDVIE